MTTTVSCQLIGCDKIGKTTFLRTYRTSEVPAPGNYVPHLSGNIMTNLTIDEHEVHLILFDSDEEQLIDERSRFLTLEKTKPDVILLCFSLINPQSLQKVESSWVYLAKEVCPGIPYILVGLQSDMRDGFDSYKSEFPETIEKPIYYDKGLEVKIQIGATEYIECTSTREDTIQAVLELAAKTALAAKKETCK